MDVLDVRTFPQVRGLITRYVYLFESSDVEAAGSAVQEFSADVNQSLVNSFCDELGEVVSTRADARKELRRIGRMLYQVLFPELQGTLPDLVRRVRNSQELFIRTNEATVPWEALYDVDEFFGLKYQLGRQYVVRKHVARGRVIGPIERVLFVADPAGDLPSAAEEAEMLAETFQARGAQCEVLATSRATVTRVVRELATGNYDLLHYSGHLAVLDGTQEAALALHGDELLDRGTIEALLHGAAPPVVFINACASAEPLSNLCSSFMASGSRVVIGTLHQVSDGVGLELSTHFYAQLMNEHETAGGALREARRAVNESHGPAWASFVLYGNPMTHIGTPEAAASNGTLTTPNGAAGPEPALSEPDAVEDDDGCTGPRLDADAEALLACAAEHAGSRGVVTSFDLFLQLIQVDEALQTAIGAERLPMIQLVVGDLLHAAGGLPRKDVAHSDTVTRVLVVASEIALRSGRELTSVRDIAQAYINVGGGTSSLLLAAIGIDLSRLDLTDATPGEGDTAGADPTLRAGFTPAGPSDGNGSDDGPFDDDAVLMSGRFAPSTLAAMEAARGIAAANQMMISSEAMLLGFGRAGSPVLVESLEHFGQAGRSLARRMREGDGPLRIELFSARTFAALKAADAVARAAGNAQIDDGTLLRALLADPTSSVWTRLHRLGVDPEQLVELLGGSL